MNHSCPDGTHSKLIRTGPVGTREGVTFSCPRCGYSDTAESIWQKANALRPAIVAALSK